MFKRNALALAIGSIALFSGCATSPATTGLTIEPVMSVRGGVGAEAQYRIGRYYQGQMRLEAAEQAFLKALALDPTYAEAHNALGTVYFELGRIQKAEEQFKLAIDIAPTRAHLHNNLAYLYQEIGRTDEAVSAYSEAFRLDPKNLRILNNLASLTCQDKGECMAAVSEKEAASTGEPASGATPRPNLSMNAAMTAPGTTVTPLAPMTVATPTMALAPTVQLENVAPNVWELRPAAPTVAQTPVVVETPVVTTMAMQQRSVSSQPVSLSAGRVELANGNGTRGMAKRVGAYLREAGYAAPRLTNHQTFRQKSTEIQYVAGAEAMARQLGRSLGHPARFVQVAALERQAPVRVVLGKDFNEAVALAKSNKPTASLVAMAERQQEEK